MIAWAWSVGRFALAVYFCKLGRAAEQFDDDIPPRLTSNVILHGEMHAYVEREEATQRSTQLSPLQLSAVSMSDTTETYFHAMHPILKSPSDTCGESISGETARVD